MHEISLKLRRRPDGSAIPRYAIGQGGVRILRQLTITFTACYAVRPRTLTSRRYVSAGTPERRDPPPGSWEGQTASHRAKSPRHVTHSPVPETLPARDLARRPIQARKLARARPPVRARRSDCAAAKPPSKRLWTISLDRSFHGGANDACLLL